MQHLVANESQLDAVTEAVAAQHSKLLGFPQPVAECWYIVKHNILTVTARNDFWQRYYSDFQIHEWRFECMLYKSLFCIFRKNQRVRLW